MTSPAALGDEFLFQGGAVITGNQTPGTAVSFIQAGTGAVTRNMQDKVRESVSVKDFGAVGDGVTDDTTALTAFFNSAIANAGVQHVLFNNTYAVSAVMPTINVSNVWITGAGSEIHNVGELMSGTVIKWIGVSNPSEPIIKISSISGASNAKISDIKFIGIGIDCNNGACGYGMRLSSIWNSDIDVAIANAGSVGLDCNSVSALGEETSTQRCRIKLQSRQIEAASGFGMVCSGNYSGGSSTGNFSMNEVWIDAVHKNIQPLYLVDSDNNDWVFFRAYKVPSGTASESVSCLGGPTDNARVRAERFWQFTANTPLHAYGTPAYPHPATSINIYNLDAENGTPVPVVETGASVFWKKDTTALPDTPWQTYTPTLSASSGSLTTATAAGQYQRRGNIVHLKVNISITTNGTAAGELRFTVPIPSTGTYGNMLYGAERAITGNAVYGFLDGGGATVANVKTYAAAYPGGDGYVINVSGFYEVT
jgi:hypothetical protein